MGISGLKKIFGTDQDLTLVQNNIDQVFQRILKIPFLDGILLEGVLLGTTRKTITHKLEREFTGFIVMRRNANAVIFESPSATPADTRIFIELEASAAVTVDIWIF